MPVAEDSPMEMSEWPSYLERERVDSLDMPTCPTCPPCDPTQRRSFSHMIMRKSQTDTAAADKQITADIEPPRPPLMRHHSLSQLLHRHTDTTQHTLAQDDEADGSRTISYPTTHHSLSNIIHSHHIREHISSHLPHLSHDRPSDLPFHPGRRHSSLRQAIRSHSVSLATQLPAAMHEHKPHTRHASLPTVNQAQMVDYTRHTMTQMHIDHPICHEDTWRPFAINKIEPLEVSPSPAPLPPDACAGSASGSESAAIETAFRTRGDAPPQEPMRNAQGSCIS
eukprot:TRINITY_DN2533_c0_g1_i3.p1 TRINITY_DN2533_c0_g1~~TRINITY_DN2533_c0_g1_i3.p1  ORF type:complete len:281 (-),score=41.03 TRINITY_DN2533_c0_g1_i3:114-956(-)